MAGTIKAQSTTADNNKKTEYKEVTWDDAEMDDDIIKGDRVIITAIEGMDDEYDNRASLNEKKGVAQDDIVYNDDFYMSYYNGTIKLDNGKEIYFSYVKLVKVKKP